MKGMIVALATAAGLTLTTGVVNADPGGFAPPIGTAGGPGVTQLGGPGTLLGAGDLPPGRGPDRYGLNPSLRKLFHLGSKSKGCDPMDYGKNPLQNPAYWAQGGYGMGGPAYNPHGFPPGAYGPVMQGTLVFPHQPFIRSPRDFFMLDLNK